MNREPADNGVPWPSLPAGTAPCVVIARNREDGNGLKEVDLLGPVKFAEIAKSMRQAPRTHVVLDRLKIFPVFRC
jgi:hypothetical protein